jgi:hypothetical protein
VKSQPLFRLLHLHQKPSSALPVQDGCFTSALYTIRSVLALEPSTNAQAVQLRDKVQALESHVRNFESARKKKEWGLARLCLDKLCLQAIEGEGGDISDDWRIWRVELELTGMVLILLQSKSFFVLDLVSFQSISYNFLSDTL